MDSATVAADAGVTYRQLDYWVRKGIVNGPRDTGQGHAREWTKTEASRIRLMGHLVRAGLGPRKAATMCAPLLAGGCVQLAPGIRVIIDEEGPPDGQDA